MPIIYETTEVDALGVAGGGEVVDAVAVSPVVARGRPGGSDTLSAVDDGSALMHGKGIPGGRSLLTIPLTSQIVGKGIPGSTTRARMFQRSSAPVGLGVASGADVLHAVGTRPVVGKGVPAGSTVLTGVDTPLVTAKGKPGGRAVGTVAETTLVAALGIPSARQLPLRLSGTTLVTGKGVPAGTSSQAVISRSVVAAKGKPGGSDALAAVDTGLVIALGQAYGANSPTPFQARNLVDAVRANCKAILTECMKGDSSLLQFPEALPTKTLAEGDLPFCVLLFGEPRPGQGAVNQIVQVIPCDIVLVFKLRRDGVGDIFQYMRGRLGTLEQKLLTDYRQKAGTKVPACNNTTLTASSFSKANQYQQTLSGLGEQIAVMVTSFEFTSVADRV